MSKSAIAKKKDAYYHQMKYSLLSDAQKKELNLKRLANKRKNRQQAPQTTSAALTQRFKGQVKSDMVYVSNSNYINCKSKLNLNKCLKVKTIIPRFTRICSFNGKC